jgi:hypothetical protein
LRLFGKNAVHWNLLEERVGAGRGGIFFHRERLYKRPKRK